MIEILAEGIDREGIDADAGVAEKLIDQGHGIRFAPHVILHELLRLVGPWMLSRKPIELVDNAWIIPSTLGRQPLRSVRLVFWKFVFENFGNIILNVFVMESTVRLELFDQKSLQRPMSARLDQARLQAAPA